MENKKIAILYNQPSAGAKADELDILDEVAVVSGGLVKLGYEVHEVPFTLDIRKAIDHLKSLDPKCVFNLVESVENKGDLIFFAPAILSSLKIPYTGARLESMFITSNKVMTKKELIANNIPTAPMFYPGTINSIDPRRQYILKPLWEEGSLGLDEENVFCGNNIIMIEKIKNLRKEDFFIEEFIDGRELNISILAGPNGPQVLPPAEIIFLDYPDDKPKVIGYTAKWLQDTFEYKHTTRSFEFSDADKPLLDKVHEICHRCWDVFDLHGHIRIDFRIDHNGNPYILEINTNPCISPDGGFYAATQKANIPFEKVVERIVNDAMH